MSYDQSPDSFKVRESKTLTFFLAVVALLIIIGFIFIYSSSSIYALERLGKPHYFVVRHLSGFVLGGIGLVICRSVSLEMIKKLTPYAFFGSVLLTSLTLISGMGIEIHGSRRWISLFGIVMQPSELLKATLVLYLAFILAKKRFSLRSFMHGYVPFLCIIGIASLILLKQPDFGQTITVCLMAFLLFFTVQVRTEYLLATVIPLIPLTAFLIYSKPYRFKRILIFLNPWQEPHGAGFQIIQSLIAIGSGRFFGLGIANSKQKFFYLPMQHTDFIFSIIAEETGFLGSCILITLYMLFLYFGLKLASEIEDPFSSYTVLGFVTITTIQAIINLGVTTGLLPTKGIGLPFVSYGNSALICSLCMIGIIINCARTRAD